MHEIKWISRVWPKSTERNDHKIYSSKLTCFLAPTEPFSLLLHTYFPWSWNGKSVLSLIHRAPFMIYVQPGAHQGMKATATELPWKVPCWPEAPFTYFPARGTWDLLNKKKKIQCEILFRGIQLHPQIFTSLELYSGQLFPGELSSWSLDHQNISYITFGNIGNDTGWCLASCSVHFWHFSTVFWDTWPHRCSQILHVTVKVPL